MVTDQKKRVERGIVYIYITIYHLVYSNAGIDLAWQHTGTYMKALRRLCKKSWIWTSKIGQIIKTTSNMNSSLQKVPETMYCTAL